MIKESFLIRLARKYVNWKRSNNILKDFSLFEDLIVNKALSYASSSKVKYCMTKKNFFYIIIDLIYWKATRRRRLYNFPKAFLFVGLSEYALKKNDLDLTRKIAISFQRFMNSDGSPVFPIDIVDQVPFGLASLNLYKLLGEEKFKYMAECFYLKINDWRDPATYIIQYRKNSNILLNDMLGMVCPFLIKYGEVFNDDNAIKLAFKQIEYYIKYGVEGSSHLPFHGIMNDTKIKVGPTNWGRGIGWYILALSSYVNSISSKKSDLFKNELIKLIETLESLKNKDGVWSQFPGSSERFDASSTIIFMYSMNLANSTLFSREKIFREIGNYITNNGVLLSSSGETHGVNSYSDKFGESELSQGILLMLIATTY